MTTFWQSNWYPDGGTFVTPLGRCKQLALAQEHIRIVYSHTYVGGLPSSVLRVEEVGNVQSVLIINVFHSTHLHISGIKIVTCLVWCIFCLFLVIHSHSQSSVAIRKLTVPILELCVHGGHSKAICEAFCSHFKASTSILTPSSAAILKWTMAIFKHPQPLWSFLWPFWHIYGHS